MKPTKYLARIDFKDGTHFQREYTSITLCMVYHSLVDDYMEEKGLYSSLEVNKSISKIMVKEK
jgi:hypothetical protein